MILDQLKLTSDDANFNENHVIFLLNKYRALAIKEEYERTKKELDETNKQLLCLNLIEVPAISGEVCEEGTYLRSVKKLPKTLNLHNNDIQVTVMDYFNSNISYVSVERFRWVGHNKWLKNIIYATIAPDNYVYLKSDNPQFLYLEKIKLSAVFEDPEKVQDLLCDKENFDTICDILERDFPVEMALVPSILERVRRDLYQSLYNKEDENNNAKDDLAER
nr:MAG TPA: Structural protein [Caudoviricetes sp.]